MGSLVSATGQQPVGGATHRPKVFAPDDENLGFDDAAPPSDILLDALLKTEEAKGDGETREVLSSLDRESQRKLFQVVRVDLGKAGEEDYIALGNGPMTGADNNWFWIIRVHQSKAKVLLFTNGLTVEVLRRRTNGYFDIKESWAGNAGSASRLYRYTGSMYKVAKSQWKDAKR